MTKTELSQFPSELHRRLMDSTKLWVDLYNVCEFARVALFYGPPGTGKSTVQCKHGLKGRTVERQVITAETVWAEIRGQDVRALGVVSSSKETFIDGPAVRSWREGRRLVIEEINEAGGDVIPGLHLVADGTGIASMTLPTGETIKPHDRFQLFASMNAEPSALPEALNDRFVIKRLVDSPDPRLLMSLPKCLRPAAAFSLFGEDKTLQITTRQWVEIGQMIDLHGWSVEQTLEFVFGPRGNAGAIAKAIKVRATVDAAKA